MGKIVWKNKRDSQPLYKRLVLSFLEGVKLKSKNVQDEITYSPFIEGLEGTDKTKEKLILLLKIAAEVEHRLMVQYLFTAYSIKDDVENLQNIIVKIAVQEMGHLLAVQNLLLSVGGIESLHLDSSKILSNSEENPLPFTLESFDLSVLAGFLTVEAPSIIPSEVEIDMRTIRKMAEDHYQQPIKSVGGLYRRLFWLFQPTDEPVQNPPDLMQLSPNNTDQISGDHIKSDDFISQDEISKYEATRDLWNKNGTTTNQYGITLSRVYSSDDALVLVNEISEQGEGDNFNDDKESHFEDFFKAFKKIAKKDGNVFIAKQDVNVFKVQKNITLSQIENEYSRLWVKLFNVCYTSLLLDIYSSYRLKPEDNYDAKEIINSLIYQNMRDVLGYMSGMLFKLPLLKGEFVYDQEPRCAPTFEIESDFHLDNDLPKLLTYHGDLVKKIEDIIVEILSNPDYEIHGMEDEDILFEVHITSIRQYVKNKLEIIKPINV